MKKLISTFGLLMLLMVVTSFTTPNETGGVVIGRPMLETGGVVIGRPMLETGGVVIGRPMLETGGVVIGRP